MTTTKVNNINQCIERMYSFTDFACELIKATPKSRIGTLINNTIFKSVFESASEVFPVVNFCLKFLGKLLSKDLTGQCMCLCTLAYQYAIITTIKENPDILLFIPADKQPKLESFIKSQNIPEISLDLFDKDFILSTTFVKNADLIMINILKNAGLNQADSMRFMNTLHLNFQKGVAQIIADNATGDKFKPLLAYLKNRPAELKSKLILKEFAEYSSWLYKSAPLYGDKPFALADIYVKPSFYNPAELRYLDLEEKILQLIFDEKFNNFISINGTAGSGKSSFTLRLTSKLCERGLIPVRINFKEIDFDTSKIHFEKEDIYKALGDAVSFKNELRYGSFFPQVPNNLFCDGNIFNERLTIKEDAYISPYVIILDGWDELNNDIQDKLRYFIDGLYKTFIKNKNNVIRVILTGRPSLKVSNCLAEKRSQDFTISELNYDDIVNLINKLDYFKPMYSIYKDILLKKFRTKSYEILNSPLILFILHELFTDSEDLIDIEKLFENKALLYKTLADLTCKNAGKYMKTNDEHLNTKLYDAELRTVLKKTAAVISIKGTELVSYEDLNFLLTENELKITKDDATKALVSYYFKGQHYNAGCEFIHKSFREYFYAEYITEEILWGNKASEKNLVKLLSTKNIESEEANFIEGLLSLFILNSNTKKIKDTIIKSRNQLISLWRKWCKDEFIKKSFNKHSSETEMSLHTKNIINLCGFESYTESNMNAYLGCNILRLNIILNKIILKKYGIHSLRDVEVAEEPDGNCLAKVRQRGQRNIYSVFAPFALDKIHTLIISDLLSKLIGHKASLPDFEMCYLESLNILNTDLHRINFRKCILKQVIFKNSNLSGVAFEDSNMSVVTYMNSDFSNGIIKYCSGTKVSFINTDLNRNEFNNSVFNEFGMYCLSAGEFTASNCELINSTVQCIDAPKLHLNNCNFSYSKFLYSNLEKGKIREQSKFNNASFYMVKMNNVDVHDSDFSNSKFTHCSFVKTLFSNPNLTTAKIVNSHLKGVTFQNGIYKKTLITNINIENCLANDVAFRQIKNIANEEIVNHIKLK